MLNEAEAEFADTNPDEMEFENEEDEEGDVRPFWNVAQPAMFVPLHDSSHLVLANLRP